MIEAATESQFTSTESLLAPLIIGFHLDMSSTDYLDLSVRGAISALPSASVQINLLLKGNRKAQLVAHERLAIQGTDKLGNVIVRLCDRRTGEENDVAWPRWRWQVTCAILQSNDGPAPIPEAPTNILLFVSRFQLARGQIDSSTQLAFFRHFVVEGLRGIDPELIVLGGQHDWKDAWWSVSNAD